MSKTPNTDVATSKPRSQGPGHGGPKSGIPARGQTLPPFPETHSLSLGHGAHSPRVYGELAQVLAAGLLEIRPDLQAYPVAVARWAEWEGRAQLLRKHLAVVGDIDASTGEVRPGLTKWLHRCENAAERAAALLGLDPISEARLAKERASAQLVAVDLAEIAARGRQILDQRADDQHLEPTDPAHLALTRVKADGLNAWEKAAAIHNGYEIPESQRAD